MRLILIQSGCGVLAGLLLLAAGCAGVEPGGLTGQQEAQSADSFEPAAQFSTREVDLAPVLAELRQLEPPSGADVQVFDQLKAELERVLRAGYSTGPAEQAAFKTASGLSPAQMSQAWCLQDKITGSTSVTLMWRGRHAGDYDLNGEVNISDLTPLGVLYGSVVELDADGLPVAAGNNEWKRQVDGDENGELNISDVTPIGVNFLSTQTGYRVYLGRSSDGASLTWDAQFLPNPANPGLQVTLPLNRSTAAGEVLRYSLGLDLPSHQPGETVYARIVPFDGQTEGEPAVVAIIEGPHESFQCDLCHNVTSYAFRGEPGVCDSCHGTPPEDSAKAWSDAPGMHGLCMGCHQSHGFAIAPPESVCSDCHTDKPSASHFGGQTECLGCHVRPHLPVVDTAAGTCMGCHPTPPEDNQLTWSMAPGLHNKCLNCHPGEHPDKPVPAESVCGNCHPAIVAEATPDKKLECLICHQFAHVPDAAPDSQTCQGCHATEYTEFQQNAMDSCMNCHGQHAFEITYQPALCQQCHATPPEDAAADWADAPGLHNQCASCHDRHGFVIAEPNTVCADCHQPLIDGGHAGGQSDCLGCHGTPHLPASGGDCQACHPTPPENESAQWADAPGLHADCLQCHPGDHPDKPVPPESICADCHTDKPNPDHGGGLSTCLDCHQFAHLPVTDLSQLDCQACHPAPPENLAAQWTDAPGLHAACLQCHAGPEHGNKPVPPESICGSCHTFNPQHGGGLTTCLDCHFVPHLPNTDITKLNCKGCHPVPPERPTKEWGDAPGDHDLCFECHDQPWHGYAPEPTRAFCRTCHDENHGGATACIDCHLYEHVPIKP